MSDTVITNSQYVRIRLRTASLGERFLAYATDVCICMAYAIGCLVLTQHLESIGSTPAWLILTVALPVLLYPLFWETLNQGQTPGKMLFRLRVIRSDGSSASFESYLMRWLLQSVDLLPGGSVGMLSIILTDKNQRLGDLAADTIVIKEPNVRKNRVSLDEFRYLSEDYRPRYPLAADLTAEQANLIRHALETPSRSRIRQLALLARKTSRLLHATPATDTTDEQFLQTVLNDYRYYQSQEGQ